MKQHSVTCPSCLGTGLNDIACGQTVRYLRERKAMSLRSLAAHCEMSPTYLSDLETGRRHWSPKLFAEVCVELSIVED